MTQVQKNGNGGGRPQVPTKTELAQQEKAPLDSLRDLLEKAQGRIAEVVPKHLTPERLTRLALVAASKDPKLLKCSGPSILLALIQAAGLGLEPNTPLHQCYLIPYENKKNINGQWVKVMEAQFQLGYRGMILLAMQSGDVFKIDAQVVRAKDVFVYRYLLDNDVLEHIPTEEAEPGPIRGAYCKWKLANGSASFVYWPAARLEAHREKYALRDFNTQAMKGVWVDHFGPMCLKTVVRDASRFWPMSSERSQKYQQAIDMEENTATGEFNLQLVEQDPDSAPPADAKQLDQDRRIPCASDGEREGAVVGRQTREPGED
jgi:recombination protein RecT